jgi:hypothetical protein
VAFFIFVDDMKALSQLLLLSLLIPLFASSQHIRSASRKDTLFSAAVNFIYIDSSKLSIKGLVLESDRGKLTKISHTVYTWEFCLADATVVTFMLKKPKSGSIAAMQVFKIVRLPDPVVKISKLHSTSTGLIATLHDSATQAYFAVKEFQVTITKKEGSILTCMNMGSRITGAASVFIAGLQPGDSVTFENILVRNDCERYDRRVKPFGYEIGLPAQRN